VESFGLSENKLDIYIDILEREYLKRKKKNSRYSYSAFSRDIGLSSSFLNLLLNKKRGLSLEMSHRVCRHLKLSIQDEELFSLSIQSCFSRDVNKKEIASEKLKKIINFNSRTNNLSQEEFSEINHPDYLSTLALLNVTSFSCTVENLADRLSLTQDRSVNVLNDLVRLGYIERVGSQHFSLCDSTRTSDEAPSESIKSFHRSVLSENVNGLDLPIDEREFLHLIYAGNKSDTLKAKRKIKKFIESFNQEFSINSSDKNSVYQISIQFMRTDH
jgi:uncharacterized protein (TIGR02147 family)